MNIHFVSFCSDFHYLYLLNPFLESLSRNQCDYTVSVLHYSIPKVVQKSYRQIYLQLDFEKIIPPNSSDSAFINSARIQHYLDWAVGNPGAKNICYIDCDVITLRPFDSAFSNAFDCAFTYKYEKFPLNFGVIFARNSKKLHFILQHIIDSVIASFACTDALKQAVLYSGAADQHSINILAQGKSSLTLPEIFTKSQRDLIYQKTIILTKEENDCRILFLPCAIYNQTECVPRTDSVAAFHLKGGWHSVLRNYLTPHYNDYRPRSSCEHIFKSWVYFVYGFAEKAASTVGKQMCKQVSHSSRTDSLATPYKQGGILPSELLAISTLIESEEIELLVESGRYNGYSTEVIASRHAHVKIMSFDRLRDNYAKSTEHRLVKYKNISFHYGDTTKVLLYNLLGIDKPFAILIDGPKGAEAVNLALKLFQTLEPLRYVFIHDTYKGSEARDLIEKVFPWAWFTDSDDYVSKSHHLDSKTDFHLYLDPTKYSFTHQSNSSKSYGPTLAIIPNYYQQISTATRWQKLLALLNLMKSKLIDALYVYPRYYFSKLTSSRSC